MWSKQENWDPIRSYLNKKPVLGWYNEGYPVVSDWEIKFCVEAGISYTLSCWYRTKESYDNNTVEKVYNDYVEYHHLTEYGNMLPYAYMWENTPRDDADIIKCIATGREDFINTYVKYWIKNEFTKPYYKKIDNKPVFAVFDTDSFIEQLGGVSEAKEAIKEFRNLARQAGYSDIILLGQWCFQNERYTRAKKAEVGFDNIFSYNLPAHAGILPQNFTNQDVAQKIEEFWVNNDYSIPYIPSVSVGWDYEPWGSTPQSKYFNRWRFSPSEYKDMLIKAKDYIDKKSGSSLNTKTVYLDCWNEYGEGHVLMPDCREGFSYLDAIREVFAR